MSERQVGTRLLLKLHTDKELDTITTLNNFIWFLVSSFDLSSTW